MEHTTVQDYKLYIGRQDLARMLRAMIKSYRFSYNNTDPVAVVIPHISDVDGVDIIYEEGEWKGNNDKS